MQPSPEDYGTELLRRYHENLSEIFTDNQVLLKVISHVKSLAPGEKEVRVGGREDNKEKCGHIHTYMYTFTFSVNIDCCVEKC